MAVYPIPHGKQGPTGGAKPLTALFWMRDSYLPTIKAPPLYKAVLLLIASYANPDGTRIFQSSRGIASLLGCDRKTVQNALKFWRDQSVLVLTHSGNGRNHANEYRINLNQETNGGMDTPFLDANGGMDTPFEQINGGQNGGQNGGPTHPPPKSPKLPNKKERSLRSLNITERRTQVTEDFSLEVYEALLEFEKLRQRMRKPITERAFDLLLKRLAQLRQEGNDPLEVVNQSIMNNYQGFWPVKKEGRNGQGRQNKPSANEAVEGTLAGYAAVCEARRQGKPN